MIEQFNEDADIASTLGRIGLVSGSAYALHETYKKMPEDLPNNYFRRALRSKKGNSQKASANRLREKEAISRLINTPDFTKTKTFSRFGNLDYSSSWSLQTGNGLSAIKDRSGSFSGGYKGRSKGLGVEIQGLFADIEKVTGATSQAEIKFFSHEGSLASFSFTEMGHEFRIPLINESSEMMLGNNRYVTRGSFIRSKTNGFNGEVEGMDVAYVKKLRASLGDIKSGKITPKEIHEEMIKKAVWEDSRGDSNMAKVSARGDIRRDQAIVDPFEDIKPWKRKNVVRDLSVNKKLSGGSAAMQAKGIVTLEEGLLHKGLPGAETSGSIYQLFRENKIEKQPRPRVRWSNIGGEEGLARFNTYTLGDYTYVDKTGNTKTISAAESLKNALKELNIPAHELAQEELLVKESIKKGKISSELYTYHVDLRKGGTTFTDRLIRDAIDKGEAMGIEAAERLTSGGGLRGINLDVSKKLNNMVNKKNTIDADVVKLKQRRKEIYKARKHIQSLDRTPEIKADIQRLVTEDLKIKSQIEYKIKARGHLNKSIKDYGTLGLKDGQLKRLKVHGNGPIETIQMMRYNEKDGILDITTKTTRELGEGGKLFGGLKATIDSRTADPEIVANTVERQRAKLTGRDAIPVNDIDILAMESRVKIKGGVMTANEVPLAVMQYAENVIESGDAAAISRLEEIGISKKGFDKSYSYETTGASGKELIEKIKSFHPEETMEDIFNGRGGLGSRTSQTIVAADVHRTQAGIGRKATLSERGVMNLQAMGLDDLLTEIMNRRGGNYDPFEQLRVVTENERIAKDTTKAGIKRQSIVDDIEAIFNPDMEKRAKLFKDNKWGETAVIDLGEDIGGVRRIPVSSNPNMGEFTGVNGARERAARNLIRGANSKLSMKELMVLSEKYSQAMMQEKDTITKRLYKIKNISNSMYGQAASSLEGMDTYAAELGKKMGFKNGELASVTAMTEADIRKHYNVYNKDGGLTFDAVKKAREKDLWAISTREPIEGTGSLQFDNVRIAEEFGATAEESGTIWLAGEDQTKSLARKSLVVDFDKDAIAQMAITEKQSISQVKNFLGLEGSANIMGQEYLNSLERMSAFDLKGKAPMDILATKDAELRNALFTEKELSKAEIGRFSNAFKKIHIGGREALRRNIGREGARDFYLGEDFSHLFVENIIKSKHQSREALVSGHATDILDLLNKESGTEYARMMDSDRATSMQGIFDKMSYDDTAIAGRVREAGRNGSVSPELQKLMGINDISLANRRAKAYSEVTSIENLQKVIASHKSGMALDELGAYSAKIAEEGLSAKAGWFAETKEMARAGEKLAAKALWRIGKYAILPAAVVGLAATLISKPKVIEPAIDTGVLHESDVKYNNEDGQVAMGKTLFSIPEAGAPSYDIKGLANKYTDFKGMPVGQGMDGSLRLQDHRSHMDEHTIREMIEKGH